MWFVILGIGLLGGLLSGLFGIGGGLVMVPLLVTLGGFSQLQSQGSVLCAMLLPVGIFAVLRYHQAGNVNWSVAGVLVVGLVLGATFGAHFAHAVPITLLKKLFALLLIAAGFRYLFW